jgi:apolipoprotein N-acyltransferase
LWVAWCNVAIVEAVAFGVSLRRLVPVVTTLVLSLGYGVWRIRTLPIREVGVVALIQPNEGFREKWDAAHADSVMETLFDLTARGRALARPDLIIWPEVAIPDYLVRRPEWEARIGQVAREGHTPILTGGLHATAGPDGEIRSFNAAFFFDSTGAWRPYPVYGKHYLVPVVERVPFVPVRWFRSVPWFRRWSGGFARGEDLPIYSAGIGRFGVIICYESAFEDLPRHYRMRGAEFLVNVTNDVWYGRTAGPYQHLSHLVLRAVETRMGVARAANSGISAFVDPLGALHDATTLETRTVVAGRLQTSDVITLYARWGDWVGVLVVLTTLGLASALSLQWWGRRA